MLEYRTGLRPWFPFYSSLFPRYFPRHTGTALLHNRLVAHFRTSSRANPLPRRPGTPPPAFLCRTYTSGGPSTFTRFSWGTMFPKSMKTMPFLPVARTDLDGSPDIKTSYPVLRLQYASPDQVPRLSCNTEPRPSTLQSNILHSSISLTLIAGTCRMIFTRRQVHRPIHLGRAAVIKEKRPIVLRTGCDKVVVRPFRCRHKSVFLQYIEIGRGYFPFTRILNPVAVKFSGIGCRRI